MIESRKSWDLE